MKIQKRYLLECSIVALATVIAVVDYFGYGSNGVGVILLSIGFMLLFTFSRNGHSDLILFVCGITIYVVPYLSEILLRHRNLSLVFLALYMWVVIISRALLPNCGVRSSAAWRPLRLMPFKPQFSSQSVLILGLLGASLAGFALWRPLFPALYSVALIIFARQCRDPAVGSQNIGGALLLFAAAVVVHVLSAWSGFGRLLILTYLLLPGIIAVYYGRLVINKRFVAFLVPLGIIYGEVFRGAEHVGTDNFAGGSVSSGLFLQDELLTQSYYLVPSIVDLMGQGVLMFATWIPRACWSSKPYGIGWTFVDTYMGRSGRSDGHSIALGLWGEHLYLNPEFWLLSGSVTLLVFLLVCRRLYRCGGDFAAIAVMFQCNLLTLAWGGMASFGTRVWWFVIPGLMFIGVSGIMRRTKRVLAPKRR